MLAASPRRASGDCSPASAPATTAQSCRFGAASKQPEGRLYCDGITVPMPVVKPLVVN